MKKKSKTVGGSYDINSLHKLHTTIWTRLQKVERFQGILEGVVDNINELMQDMYHWNTKDADKIYRTIEVILDKYYVKRK